MSRSNRKLVGCFVALSAGALAVPALGDSFAISNDTFIDSGSPGSPSPTDPSVLNDGMPAQTSGVDEYSYGADGKVKAVTSNYSTSYPYTSATHVLFTLPSSFWNDIGTGPVTSAIVSYYAFNDSLNPADGHGNMELHPLTTGFTTGNGQQSNSSKALVPSTTGGATWETYDGNVADTWSTPGGDYDNKAGDYVLANVGATLPAAKTAFTWDITSLINNPVTRSELQSDGALIKVVGENITPTYNGSNAENDFVSFYSADEQAAGTSTGGTTGSDAAGAFLPTVSVVVPEPVGLTILTAAGMVSLVRRRTAGAL